MFYFYYSSILDIDKRLHPCKNKSYHNNKGDSYEKSLALSDNLFWSFLDYSSLIVQTLMLSSNGTFLKATSFVDGKEYTQYADYLKLEGTAFVRGYEDSPQANYLTAKYETIKTPYKVTSNTIKLYGIFPYNLL